MFSFIRISPIEKPTEHIRFSRTTKLSRRPAACLHRAVKKVLCVLENGFEEMEAITPIDLLRRAEIQVCLASASTMELTGKSNIHVKAEVLLEDIDPSSFDILLLPGGPAVTKLRGNALVRSVIHHFHTEGKLIAAICAAPLLLLDAGILPAKKFTAHFSTMSELPQSSGLAIDEDQNLLTSRGAGTVFIFGIRLVEILCGPKTADQIKSAVMA